MSLSSSRVMTRCLLTFDDGPHDVTTRAILDTLAASAITAAFFVVGDRLLRPARMRLAERIVAEGHLLGNHSFSHSRLVGTPPDATYPELERTQELIEAAGEHRRVFRPPYGKIDSVLERIALQLGYDILLWNVDAMDWKFRCGQTWLRHVKTQLGKVRRQTVLMHDIHESTARGLGNLISDLREMASVTIAPVSDWRDFVLAAR